ncbi:uncharacterized protein EV420DRAFT_319992 [Desarmillaria tabescens]|uniref:Uncharacterized protein n=1 Tax=Armillaria tabescens TaxID=1929756 RepID=A0AA39N6P7_ARMTA|nr:uncharacterized protein EV420DRAFT_319992 [Desarmillaria tabescens]KAK0459408.1 hypothetical protein EV420DRAFT_319992 [Desarmillaria tabescens]
MLSFRPNEEQLVALKALIGTLDDEHLPRARSLLGEDLWSQIIFLSVQKTERSFLSNGKVSNRVAITNWDVIPVLNPIPCDRCQGRYRCEYTVSGRNGKCRRCRLGGKRCSWKATDGATIVGQPKQVSSSAGSPPQPDNAPMTAAPSDPPPRVNGTSARNQEKEGLKASLSYLLAGTLPHPLSLTINSQTAASAVQTAPDSSPWSPALVPSSDSELPRPLRRDDTVLAAIRASPVQYVEDQGNKAHFLGSASDSTTEPITDQQTWTAGGEDLVDDTSVRSRSSSVKFVGSQYIISEKFCASAARAVEKVKGFDNHNPAEVGVNIQVQGAKRLRACSVGDTQEPRKE